MIRCMVGVNISKWVFSKNHMLYYNQAEVHVCIMQMLWNIESLPIVFEHFATIQMTNPILVTNYLKLRAARILALVTGRWSPIIDLSQQFWDCFNVFSWSREGRRTQLLLSLCWPVKTNPITGSGKTSPPVQFRPLTVQAWSSVKQNNTRDPHL